ncbi:MAG TPA: hypothetical protein VIT22_13710 [Pseudoxanthomonas sp.]
MKPVATSLAVETEIAKTEASARPPGRTPLYADPRKGTRTFRVALVTPSVVPAWVSSLMDLVADNPWLELSAIPVTGRTPSQPVEVPFDLSLFLALDRLLVRRVISIRRDTASTLSGTPLARRPGVAIEPEAQQGEGSEGMRARLERLKPDLVLLIGFEEWATIMADVAPWGCWVLDASLVNGKHAGLPLLTPILNGEDATPLCLELGLAPDRVVPLGTAWGSTRAMSFSQHRDLAFVKLPAMVMSVLRNLADGVLPIPRQQAAVLRLAPPREAYRAGTGFGVFWATVRHAVQWVPQWRRNHKPWFVLLRNAGTSLDPASPQMGPNSVLVAPPGDYWADPFAVEHGHRQFVFVEEWVGLRRLGIIVCLELLPDGNAQRLGVVLDEDSHMSYPQVFQWEGVWYMTVENGAARRVSLYRATDFPLGWERVADLITDQVCFDPTLHPWQGMWYLFGNVSECFVNASDDLFLFVSERLEGPYRPHPSNPIVCDVRCSRPAGQLFLEKGQLIRPAQCSVPVYGAAIVFNQVITLSPTDYSERPIGRLDPGWAPSLDGCHTYNKALTLEVLDAHGEPPGNGVRINVLDRG